MIANRRIQLLLIGAMLVSSLSVVHVSARSNYDVLAVLVWTVGCVWNAYAFFFNRDMLPSQFSELKKDGRTNGRTFVFWATVFLHFAGLLGVYFQIRG